MGYPFEYCYFPLVPGGFRSFYRQAIYEIIWAKGAVSLWQAIFNLEFCQIFLKYKGERSNAGTSLNRKRTGNYCDFPQCVGTRAEGESAADQSQTGIHV
jgi:hypothetical protein